MACMKRYIQFTGEQRKIFSEKLADLGNIVAGALVFGRLVTGEKFHLQTFLLGLIFPLFFYLWSYILSRGIGERQLP